MRTSLDLPDELLRQLKAKAALSGVSLKTLLRELLERGLNAPPASPTKPAPSELPTLSAGHPLPAALMSNAALFDLMSDEA